MGSPDKGIPLTADDSAAPAKAGRPPKKLAVAVLDDYQDVALRYGDWSVLAGDADVTVFTDHLHDTELVVERLRHFDAICLMRERTPMPAAIIDRLPRLKLIVTTGLWNAAIDVAHARSKGIAVCGTHSIQSGTPELTWLLILALARNLPAEQASMRAGGWQTAIGMDLRKRTIGILGLGTIGARIARVANAFGMRVIAWSHNLSAERAAESQAIRVDKDDLFREADFITVHLRLSERTRGLVGAPEFSLMKPTAFLVNTSRAPIVDEKSLLAALDRGTIAGAGIDVFSEEPVRHDHPLRSHPKVVATPHIGYVTEATYRLFYSEVAENIRAWLDGRPLREIDDAA